MIAVDFNKLSFKCLREIYAASWGICIGWTEAGIPNMIKTLEHFNKKGEVKLPPYPSEELKQHLNDYRATNPETRQGSI